MSDQYLYRCERCDSTVLTDDNGCECTMGGIAYLYHCSECGLLAKVWTDIQAIFEPKDNDNVKSHWYIPNKGSYNFDGTCPLCGSKHIHKWNPLENGCSTCGGKMSRDDSFGVVHTD